MNAAVIRGNECMERILVEHCAPTLAGLKTAGLVTVAFDTQECAQCEVCRLNRLLAGKGVRVIPLQYRNGRMGGFAGYISGVCLIMGVLVMYLLTKIIIDKNASSISMVKVLGYKNSEINALYVRLTTAVTVVLTVTAALASLYILKVFFRFIMYNMEGWMDLFISPGVWEG